MNEADIFFYGETVTLPGTVISEYTGKIYPNSAPDFNLDSNYIICISNSYKSTDGTWSHSIKDVFRKGVYKKVSDIKELSNVTHFIIINETDWSVVDKVDDLKKANGVI